MKEKLIQQAIAHHQAGQLDEAKTCCLQVLASDPRNAAAQHLLGLLEFQQGRAELGAKLVSAAIDEDDSQPNYHANLGEIYRTLGRLADAEQCYRRALAIEPKLVEIRRKLGDVLKRQQKAEEAIRCYVEVLQSQTSDVKTMHNLGVLLHAERHHEAAAALYERILQIEPTDAVAQFNHVLANMHNGRLAEGESLGQRYLQINPRDVGLHVVFGMTLYYQGKFAEAIEIFQRATILEPNHAEAHYRLGVSLLALGDLKRGWQEFEWRLKTRFAVPAVPLPRWNGEPLAGKSILVYAEFGLGDTMHFARYLPMLEARQAKVVLAVQPPLVPLFRESVFAHVASTRDSLPRCDWQVPLLSLPMHFGTTLDNIPCPIPYLRASTALVDRWRERLASYPGFRIGIHWRCQSRAKPETRLIPLTAFAGLARLPGVRLISLQKSDESQELHALGGQFEVVDFGDELDTTSGAFMDTAALVDQLDLVITCDTSIAHLAGAMGGKVWVGLPQVAENRWLVDREDSPWYPTMRLFRQSQAGQWSDVFEKMSEEVSRILAAQGATPR